MQVAFSFARKLLIRGVLTVLPLAVTVWLVWVGGRFLTRTIGAAVAWVLRLAGVEDVTSGWWVTVVPLLGILSSLAILMLVGLLATNLFGKRLLAGLERLLLRVPFVRPIYAAAKQLLEAFTVGRRGAFREVVAFEYPRPGIWVLGFVTSTLRPGSMSSLWQEEMVNVFLPTTPNPTSGFLLILPARDVRRLDITVEEGVKMIVSGGLVLPPTALGGAPPPERNR